LVREVGTETKTVCFGGKIKGRRPNIEKNAEGGFFSPSAKLNRNWETNVERREVDGFANIYFSESILTYFLILQTNIK
jgi:hypothetical protein